MKNRTNLPYSAGRMLIGHMEELTECRVIEGKMNSDTEKIMTDISHKVATKLERFNPTPKGNLSIDIGFRNDEEKEKIRAAVKELGFEYAAFHTEEIEVEIGKTEKKQKLRLGVVSLLRKLAEEVKNSLD